MTQQSTSINYEYTEEEGKEDRKIERHILPTHSRVHQYTIALGQTSITPSLPFVFVSSCKICGQTDLRYRLYVAIE